MVLDVVDDVAVYSIATAVDERATVETEKRSLETEMETRWRKVLG
jgi:hypothetical protein